MYLFVDSTRESLDKKIELIVSLTSLSRWHDSGQNEAAGLAGPTIPTIPEKSGRNTGLSNDKTAADVSPARGIASKHRASIIDHSPQPIVPHVSSHDGNIAESKKYPCKLQKQNHFFLNSVSKRTYTSTWFTYC
jgi:hypothetical protein